MNDRNDRKRKLVDVDLDEDLRFLEKLTNADVEQNEVNLLEDENQKQKYPHIEKSPAENFFARQDFANLIFYISAISDLCHFAMTSKSNYSTVNHFQSSNNFWVVRTKKMYPYLYADKLDNSDVGFRKAVFKSTYRSVSTLMEAKTSMQLHTGRLQLVDEKSKRFHKLMSLLHERDLRGLKEFYVALPWDEILYRLKPKKIPKLKVFRDLLESKNKYDMNPIAVAAAMGDWKIFEYLFLEKIDGDKNARTHFWQSSVNSTFYTMKPLPLDKMGFGTAVVKGKNSAILESLVASLLKATELNLQEKMGNFLSEVAYVDGLEGSNVLKWKNLKEIFMQAKNAVSLNWDPGAYDNFMAKLEKRINVCRLMGICDKGNVGEILNDANQFENIVKEQDERMQHLIALKCLIKKDSAALKKLLDINIRISRSPYFTPAGCGRINFVFNLIYNGMDEVLFTYIEKLHNPINFINTVFSNPVISDQKGKLYSLLTYTLLRTDNTPEKVNLVKKLIQKGAIVSGPNQISITQKGILLNLGQSVFCLFPLYAAALANDMDSFKILLENGAEYDRMINGKSLKEAIKAIPKVSDEILTLLDTKIDNANFKVEMKFCPALHELFDLAIANKHEKFAIKLQEFLQINSVTTNQVKNLYNYLLEYHASSDNSISEIFDVLDQVLQPPQLEVSEDESEQSEDESSENSLSETEESGSEEEITIRPLSR